MSTVSDSVYIWSVLNWESMKELQGGNAPPRITCEIRTSVWMEACVPDWDFFCKKWKRFHQIPRRIWTSKNDQYMSASLVYYVWSICVAHNFLKTFIFTWHRHFPSSPSLMRLEYCTLTMNHDGSVNRLTRGKLLILKVRITFCSLFCLMKSLKGTSINKSSCNKWGQFKGALSLGDRIKMQRNR